MSGCATRRELPPRAALLPLALGSGERASQTGAMSAAAIARLKITLDDVEPAVIRCVETPFDIRLDGARGADQESALRLSCSRLRCIDGPAGGRGMLSRKKEVPVQVNVILVYTAQLVKTKRIEGMNKHHFCC